MSVGLWLRPLRQAPEQLDAVIRDIEAKQAAIQAEKDLTAHAKRLRRRSTVPQHVLHIEVDVVADCPSD